MLKVTDVETKRTSLPKEGVRYGEEYEVGLPRNRFKLKTRLHNFEEKIEGKRFVDGKFVSNFVQYK